MLLFAHLVFFFNFLLIVTSKLMEHFLEKNIDASHFNVILFGKQLL